MNRARRCAAIGAIVAGAMLGTTGVTAATAQTISPTTSSSWTQNAPTLPSGVVPSTTPVAPPSGDVSTNRIPIKPIVDWLKNNASSVIPALKTALKKGITAFRNWWNGLAGWIRSAITAIGQMSIQEMFDQLWHYFFG